MQARSLGVGDFVEEPKRLLLSGHTKLFTKIGVLGAKLV